jgi:hypothetical protein
MVLPMSLSDGIFTDVDAPFKFGIKAFCFSATGSSFAAGSTGFACGLG